MSKYNLNFDDNDYDDYEDFNDDQGGTCKMRADKRIKNRSHRHSFKQQLRKVIQSGHTIEDIVKDLEEFSINELEVDFEENESS